MFFQRCFVQVSNTGVVVLTQTTKKQKLPPKSTLRRFKLNRVTLSEMQTASLPWQIHRVSSWSCFCSSLHIKWNGYRSVHWQLEISVSPSMGSDSFSEESLAQLMKWMYFVCLLLLPLLVLDFPHCHPARETRLVHWGRPHGCWWQHFSASPMSGLQWWDRNTRKERTTSGKKEIQEEIN